MNDHIENIQGATVQHGPENSSVFLKELGAAEPLELIPELTALARQNNSSKIYTKVPESKVHQFDRHNYRKEAAIPDFYPDNEAAVFMCSYPNPHQQHDPMMDVLNDIMMAAREHQNSGITYPLPEGAHLRKCTVDDIQDMAGLYKITFPAPLFPCRNSAYLKKSMTGNVHYYAVEIGGKIEALAASEIDEQNRTVELTAFATTPKQHGKGLSAHLLKEIETAMTTFGIQTSYSIVPASAPGINTSFAQLGYSFGGRLINNTPVSGFIESMNVWHKAL